MTANVYAAFQDRVRDVAQALVDEENSAWTFLTPTEPDSNYAKIAGLDDLGVSVYFNRYSEQWVIGAFQVSTRDVLSRNGTASVIEIKVNPERSVVAIARDIVRRLLPEAREALKAAQEQQAQWRAFDAQSDETRLLLIASMGGEDRRWFGHPTPAGGFSEAQTQKRTIYLDISDDDRHTVAKIIWAGDNTSIQFDRLDRELATRILTVCEAYSTKLRKHAGR